MACIRLVKKLSIDDCRRLYARIRKVLTAESRQIVKTYIVSEKDSS